ncbi:unnamed protein product [Prorocentrum cordatum]|uniref:Phospholipase B-like n=1 Tax=Prorocentrum cordatum TaxID=2364126 RepID=A0ABN9S916_9DINO|nr:unnamed protein product [Polarella glacialis]
MAPRAAAALVALAGGALRAGGLQQSPPAHEPAAGRAAERPRGEATVMALAAYAHSSDVSRFPLAFVNSLRGAGFAGKIVVGMWENTTDQTDFLRRAAVTPKYIRQAPCQLRYSEDAVGKLNPGYVTRNVCTEDFPHLKLDNARWVYGLRWLEECPTCSDWVMYADFGDIPGGGAEPLRPPAARGLGRPRDGLPDRGDAAPHRRARQAAGRQHQQLAGPAGRHEVLRPAARAGDHVGRKPMLNIATTFGTRAGMLRWLGRLAEEFENISHRIECDPVVISKSGVLNHLFYNEKAMPYATPMKYGEWIVNTMGMPCSNAHGYEPGSSMRDLAIIDSAGLVWNEDGTLPAVIHQGKVCWENYIVPHVAYNFSGTGNSSTYAATLSKMRRSAAFPGRRQAAARGPTTTRCRTTSRWTTPHPQKGHQAGVRALPSFPTSPGGERLRAAPPGWVPLTR